MQNEHGVGGSYVVGEDGVRRRVEGTQDHPEGNRPRDAQGRVIGADGRAIAEQEEPDAAAAGGFAAAPAAHDSIEDTD